MRYIDCGEPPVFVSEYPVADVGHELGSLFGMNTIFDIPYVL
jgi:hypothetical protein